MLCDICKKNEATVHLTEVVNDDVSELHICEKCARAKGASMQQHFGIAELLSGLVDMPVDMISKKNYIGIKCPGCGMSYDNFKKMGRFGCARCYDAFKRALYPLFKKIHGTSCHTGKEPLKSVFAKPKQAGMPDKSCIVKDKLKSLKAKLLYAIKNEEFERAAILRDKIKALEGKGK